MAFAANADSRWHAGLPATEPDAIHATAVSHLHGEFADARCVADILPRPA